MLLHWRRPRALGAVLATLLLPVVARAADAADPAAGGGRPVAAVVGGVIGLLLALGLYAWLFFLRTWREGEDAGFLFRLGVLLLSPIFAWGTLRSGFLVGARITAFVWMAIQLGLWAKAAGDRGAAVPSGTPELQQAFVEGCLKNEGASEELCECTARHFVQDFTLAELEELAPALKRKRPPEALKTWAQSTFAKCAFEIQAAAQQGSADAVPVDPNEPPPDIAATPCEVTSSPPGAELLLDGKPTGVKTPGKVTIWAGRPNTLVARLPGHVAASATLTPNLGQQLAQDFQLVPGVDVPVDSTPPGAQVLVDGRPVATTPGVATLAPGRAVATFRLEGHLEVQRPVEVRAGGTADPIAVALRPAATLRIDTAPSGALAWVDDVAAPVSTPSTQVIAAERRHCVALKLDGYLPVVECADAGGAGETVRLSVKLDRSTRGLLQDCAEAAGAAVKALARERAALGAKLKRQKGAQGDALATRLEALDWELAARRRLADACRSRR